MHIYCMPGNVLGEKNAEVKTLTTIIAGRTGRLTGCFFRALKETNLSILRMGEEKREKGRSDKR